MHDKEGSSHRTTKANFSSMYVCTYAIESWSGSSQVTWVGGEGVIGEDRP